MATHNSKRVLLFSRDPGGANTITPLVEPLAKSGWTVLLYGKDAALDKYTRAGVVGQNLALHCVPITQDSIFNFLKQEMPDFLITGTSTDDFTERFLWKAAEKLNIPSFAILDHWINYGFRFSKYQVSELDKYRLDPEHPFLPTRILVMDEYGRQEAIKDGVAPDKLFITGQPHFEALIRNSQKISTDQLRSVRQKMGALTDGDLLITYASEDLGESYHETDHSPHYWGYTERTIFRELLNALLKFAPQSHRKIHLVIKIHPKERVDNFDDLVATKSPFITFRVDKETNPVELIKASDLICGMSSMFLMESVILGKPILSIQIGLCRENPFVLDRMGIVQSILNSESLVNAFNEILLHNRFPRHEFSVLTNSVSTLLKMMEEFA